MRQKGEVLLPIIILLVGLVGYLIYQKSQPTIRPPINPLEYPALQGDLHYTSPTPTNTQSEEVVNNYCEVDDDCELWMCAGCVSKEWAKTAPPDLPCATYAKYSGCNCLEGVCVEVK